MSRIALGDFEIACIREGIHWWDGGAFFGVVPKHLWSRKIQPDEENRIPMGFNSYVVRTGSHTVLIETGGGDKSTPRMRERMKMPPEPEPLGATLAAAGIDPASVDVVVNSHLHWDHCGGNTRLTAGGAVAAFPNASYYASKGEWEHAHRRHLRDSVSYIDANYDPLVESGQMKLLEAPEGEIVPGVRYHTAPGHNKTMWVITAVSQGRVFAFFSDLVPTAAHLRPSWVAAFDLYPMESIDTKLEWLAAAARDGWICAFSHDASVDFATIRAAGDSYEVAATTF